MLIDDRVKAKIRFLKHSELGQLYEFIDADQLPVSLGGHRKHVLTDHSGVHLSVRVQQLFFWHLASSESL